MNARFSLSNDASAPAWAAEIVRALLIAWGCDDDGARAEAGKVASGVASRVQASPAPLLVVGLRHANDLLTVTVGAYSARGIRPEREERSTVSIVLTGDGGEPIHISAPQPAAPPPAPPPALPPPQTPAQSPAPAPPSGPVVTLADLAQRFEESAWFVRRRITAGRLPPPDGADAAGDPIWYDQTLVAWRDPVADPPEEQGSLDRSADEAAHDGDSD